MSKPSPLFVLSLSATLLMLGVGMIVALLPQRIHEMTGSLESVGLVAAVFALAYLLAQLPVGILSDRLGPGWFLMIGYLLCSASGIVYFSTQTPAGIYLGRVIQGLGEAPIWALGPAVLSLAYPSARGRVIGIYNAAIHIGLTLGPLLGLLIAPGGQGDLPFLVFAVLCLSGGILVFGFLRQATAPASRERPGLQQFLRVLRTRAAVFTLTGVLIYGAGYGVFLTVLPVSLTTTHGFGPTAVSLHFVQFYAAISLSQIVAGARSDRIGRHIFLVWGMALAAAGVASFHLVPGLWAFLPLGLASIGLGMFCVASIAGLNDSVPDSLKGAISGTYYLFWGAGYVLGPLAIGAAATNAPMLAFAVLAGLFGLQALVFQIARE